MTPTCCTFNLLVYLFFVPSVSVNQVQNQPKSTQPFISMGSHIVGITFGALLLILDQGPAPFGRDYCVSMTPGEGFHWVS